MTKTCGNCVNLEKYTVDDREKWGCENFFGCEGMLYNVEPPADEACENWTDNPKKKGAALKAMHEFTDNFWR